jgi:hypothetical protein
MHAVVRLDVRNVLYADHLDMYAIYSQLYQDADPQSRKGKEDAFVEVVTDVVVTDVGFELCLVHNS